MNNFDKYMEQIWQIYDTRYTLAGFEQDGMTMKMVMVRMAMTWECISCKRCLCWFCNCLTFAGGGEVHWVSTLSLSRGSLPSSSQLLSSSWSSFITHHIIAITIIFLDPIIHIIITSRSYSPSLSCICQNDVVKVGPLYSTHFLHFSKKREKENTRL